MAPGGARGLFKRGIKVNKYLNQNSSQANQLKYIFYLF